MAAAMTPMTSRSTGHGNVVNVNCNVTRAAELTRCSFASRTHLDAQRLRVARVPTIVGPYRNFRIEGQCLPFVRAENRPFPVTPDILASGLEIQLGAALVLVGRDSIAFHICMGGNDHVTEVRHLPVGVLGSIHLGDNPLVTISELSRN